MTPLIPNKKQSLVCNMAMTVSCQMQMATGDKPKTVFISVEADEVFERGPFDNTMEICGMECFVDYGLKGFACYVRA